MTATAQLDKARRYLVPVARLQLPREPDMVHLALYEWVDRMNAWVTGLGLCGRSTEQGALPKGTRVTCRPCRVNQRNYQSVLDLQARTVVRSVPEAVAHDSLVWHVQSAVQGSGLTQNQIAERLHVSGKHLSGMLNGRASLTVTWAERILGVCGLELVVTVRPRGGAR